jgi:DNA mismatch repair protein MutS
MPSWTNCAPSATNCDDFLLELEVRERPRTGIGNLRVQFNKVHGFYIEVTPGLDKVPADYQRRQTLKNAERFITPELKAFEDKALSAQERALAREKWLFRPAARRSCKPPAALASGPRAGQPGRAGRAGRTRRHAQLVRPEFVPTPASRSSQGRHPVVEARLAETGGGSFIANDCRLDARGACWSSPARTWAARAPSCARWR